MTAIATFPVLLGTGIHSARPSASAVGKGGLYSCTTHSLVYQTDGSSWTTWATLGATGTPVGTELDYVQKTSATTINAASEATADTIVTGASVAYDGSTIIEIHFYAVGFNTPSTAGANLVVCLYDGSSSIGFIGQYSTVANAAQIMPVDCFARITPSAASHTYGIRAYSTVSGASVYGGAGGNGAYRPAYMQIKKVS